MAEVTQGAGGIEYRGRTLLDLQHGTTFRFGFDLEEIAVTPNLHAGDALVMRGDVIHKTQNQRTNRIAVSFRAVRKNAIVHRRHLLVPSSLKLAMVQKNLQTYAAVDYVFAQAGKDYLSVEELFAGLTALDKVRRRPPASLVWHVLKFRARLWLLRATCGLW